MMEMDKGFIYSIVVLATVLAVQCRRPPIACQLGGPHRSQFVTTYEDKPSEVRACSSLMRPAEEGREVIVVHIERLAEKDVTLNLINRHFLNGTRNAGTDFNGMVIILATPPGGVSWTIHAEGLRNGTRNLIVLPPGAMVTETDISAEVVTRWRLPSNRTSQLIGWATKKYGGVTSVVKVKEANIINIAVGSSSSTSSSCDPDPDTSAVMRTSRVVYGCDALQNTGNRVTHIIQLNLKGRRTKTPAEPKHVTIDVLPGDGGAVPSEVTLVLQTTTPLVTWYINRDGFNGRLIVVHKGQIQTTSHVISQRLITNKTQYKLLAKVGREYPPVVSYAMATSANYVELVLSPSGLEKLKVEKKPNDHPSVNRPSTRWTLRVSEQQRSFLERGMHKTCLNNGMRVVIRKYQLKPFIDLQGVQKEELTLIDRVCHATENSTHFILDTALNGCGSIGELFSRGVIYKNKVFIRYKSSAEEDVDENSEDSEISGSGVGAPDLLGDDEDYAGEKTISVDFQCEYSTPGVAVKESTVEMKLYRIESYLRSVQRFPLNWEEGQRIYVSAGLRLDDQNGDFSNSQLHSCWLSSQQQWRPGMSRHYLIKDGCRNAMHLIWHGNGDNREHRFSFLAQKVFSQQTFIFVQCELVACEQCKSRNDYCVAAHKGSGSGIMGVPMTTGVAGPLVLSEPVTKPDGFDHIFGGDQSDPMFPPVEPVHDSFFPPEQPIQGEASDFEELLEKELKEREREKEKETVIVNGLGTGPVVGIAFASFVIGIALTAALWGIHAYTAPRHHRAPTRLSQQTPTPESSGQSTPNTTQLISEKA